MASFDISYLGITSSIPLARGWFPNRLSSILAVSEHVISLAIVSIRGDCNEWFLHGYSRNRDQYLIECNSLGPQSARTMFELVIGTRGLRTLDVDKTELGIKAWIFCSCWWERMMSRTWWSKRLFSHQIATTRIIDMHCAIGGQPAFSNAHYRNRTNRNDGH